MKRSLIWLNGSNGIAIAPGNPNHPAVRFPTDPYYASLANRTLYVRHRFAALCDATPGYTTFNVSYNVDGTWTVQSMALSRMSDGRLGLIERAIENMLGSSTAAANAQVLNEAGTGVLSTGNAANFDPPVTITNLSNPGNLAVYSEYQVGPTGGPYKGRMCTNLNGTTGVFSQ